MGTIGDSTDMRKKRVVDDVDNVHIGDADLKIFGPASCIGY